MKRRVMLSLIAPAAAGFAVAARGDEALRTRALEGIKRAVRFIRSISTNGGYVGMYSLDLKERWGEAVYEPAKEWDIWVQPPGTPSVGMCFLRAHRITGETEYLDAAKDAALALAWGQRKEGGWDHLCDVSRLKRDGRAPERMSGNCTLDDEITQGAISFLIELDRTIDADWVAESLGMGLRFMLESQFPNGAWPQWYPLIGGYHDYYTFNDGTINDCVRLMMEASRTYGRREYMESVQKAGGFIAASRLPAPQAAWAQQYSHDMKPVAARAFEPPCLSSASTAANIRTLVDIALFTGDEKFLAPIPEAEEWFRKSRLAENTWARMYEVGTNRPIYGDRDGKIHYTLDEISEERRKGYSWQGEYGVNGALAYYHEVRKAGVAAYAAGRKTETTVKPDEARAKRLEPAVMTALDGLDDRGRWVNAAESRLHIQDFVRNMNRIGDYLEASGK